MFNQIIGGYTNLDTTNYSKGNGANGAANAEYNNSFSSNVLKQNNNNGFMYDEILAPDYQSPDTKIKNNIIVINSIDRDWYNYPKETPYNYLVKLGGSSTDKYSTVSQNYNNVIAFAVDKIILPNRACIQSYISNIAPRLNDNPYLALVIKGIDFSSYGTNKTLNETLGIYTPLIPLPITLSDIAYLEFKNTSIQKKEYSPAPEGYISLLDLSITNPKGIIASNLLDVLDIYSIFLNPNNTIPISITDTLIIQTNTFFNAIEFRQNDLIQIQKYQYHNMSFDESNLYNSWINSPNGHYISKITKSNIQTTLYNQIEIPIPADLDRTTGNISVESWFSSFIDKSLTNIAIQDTGGKLINTNTQSHLVVNIKTLAKKDNIFFKDFE